jgi:hypothetical protein
LLGEAWLAVESSGMSLARAVPIMEFILLLFMTTDSTCQVQQSAIFDS